MKKTILFRADGNSSTGLGHLYRLFSIVESVKSSYDFVYLTKEDSTHSVIPETYNKVYISNSISIKDEPKWITENYNPENHIIIADGYQFLSSYQKSIKEFGFKLIYIDDLTTEHMYADIVINHSPQIRESDFSKEVYTKLALGMNYALLRPMFLNIAKENRIFKDFNNVFVNFGGADHYNLTELTVRVLLKIKKVKVINVVLGAAYNQPKLLELIKSHSSKIKIYRNLSQEQMVNLMASSDFAVVPSSNILFELFCVKMPVFSGYFVDNQKPAYIEFIKRSLISGSGNFTQLTMSDLHKKIQDFIDLSSPEFYILKQNDMIDGKQQSRFRELISQLA